MSSKIFSKGLAVVVIVLFIGMSIPTTGTLMSDDDTTPPVTTHYLNGTLGNNDIYVSNVEVTLTATDDQSGVNVTYFLNPPDPISEYTQPFIVSGQATHEISYYSIDNAGNQEQWHHIQINIDLYPPHIEIVGGWDKVQECWWVGADVLDDYSGIDRIEFFIEDELMHVVKEPPTNPYGWTYQYPNDHIISATVYDFAGLNATDEFFQEVSFSRTFMPKSSLLSQWLNNLLDRFPILHKLLEVLIQ